MRTAVLVLLVAVLAVPLASAETYRISGQATYSDNTPVMLRDVYVECPQGEVDCYQYRGASAITDANGQYMLAIEVEEEDDGVEIYLQLQGENFSHVIDLDTFRNTPNGRMTHNLQLSAAASGSGFFTGVGCCLVLFGLLFMSTLMRTVSGHARSTEADATHESAVTLDAACSRSSSIIGVPVDSALASRTGPCSPAGMPVTTTVSRSSRRDWVTA